MGNRQFYRSILGRMKIGIVGLGLIGGSLGLDFRVLGHQVLGVSRQPQTCELALARGAVDQAATTPEILASADVVFLCTPLGVMSATVKQIIPHLKAEAILTDVGSVKASVIDALTPLWPNFIGGHPMAGTAETGIAAAQYQLFQGRPYVLTPTASTPKLAQESVTALVQAIGSQLLICEPTAHDQAVALISHLPVYVSANLIATASRAQPPELATLAQQLASSGFKDTSRVGGGNPELGRMMAQYNQTALLKALYAYRQGLEDWITQIETHQWSDLEQALAKTQQQRPSFL
jgi:arogenate dehydrogenase (NADP+)